MIERIRELEAISRRLEPGLDERRRVRAAVVEHGDAFLDSLHDSKAYEINKDSARRLSQSPFTDEPADVHEVLKIVEECVEKPGVNPATGRFFGYIPGGGLYYASLGDYLADISNRYAGIRFAGPGAVEMENALLGWMAGLVEYPEDSGGNLASGGSIANLVAIVTARDVRGLRARDVERAVVYLSQQTHHCIDKALRIAGLGDCVRRVVPLDERYRMLPAELERIIAEDRERGLEPWMVIASAGTTDVGAIDPLQQIGQIAEQNELWYHVDAAYGGFFALVDECRPRLAGMELSDSIVLDPHKGLFLPYGLGAVLVKDKAAMHRAHYYSAAYMQDTVAEESLEISSPAELSPELTKHFRGFRLWLPLKLHGVAPFRACLEEKLYLTRYFYEEVQKLGFEVGPEPELSVATYRWIPKAGDVNAFNQALTDEIHRDGRIFISTTMLEDSFVLRLAVLTFRTHLDEIDFALEVLREKVELLLSR